MYTTIQITQERREQLGQLQVMMTAETGTVVDLRNAADRALKVGLAYLGIDLTPEQQPDPEPVK